MNDLFSPKTAVALIVGVVALVFLGFSNSFPKPADTSVPAEVVPQRATLQGTYLCLPHVDTSGPQTMECAFGILTDAGDYYAVDLSLMSQAAPQISTGDLIAANGLVTPVEMLSSDHWRNYPVKGIFSITDSLRVIARP